MNSCNSKKCIYSFPAQCKGAAVNIGLFLLFIGVILCGYLPHRGGNPDVEIAQQRKITLTEVNAAQAAMLNKYGWVDKKAGVVRIPIDQSMRMVVEAWQKSHTLENFK